MGEKYWSLGEKQVMIWSLKSKQKINKPWCNLLDSIPAPIAFQRFWTSHSCLNKWVNPCEAPSSGYADIFVLVLKKNHIFADDIDLSVSLFCDHTSIPTPLWPRQVGFEALQTSKYQSQQVGSLGLLVLGEAKPRPIPRYEQPACWPHGLSAIVLIS